ncbi:MAG: ABC transporter permease subunit [Candidatus Limnocylindrales bacterium]
MSAPAEGALGPAAVRPPSTLSRIYGLGSVFAKTLRDSRWAIVGFTILLAAILAVTATAFVGEFDTALKRAGLAGQMAALPALFQGLLGQPVAIETLPGFLSWRSLGFMPILFGLWSVVALSGTIAGEASRGSLEVLAANPLGRASIALQKVAALGLAMAISLASCAVVTWGLTIALAQLPGDQTTLAAALGMFGWILVVSLTAGAATFASGAFLGRTAAAGVGAALLFGSFIVNGYADLVPGFDVLQHLSMFDWTEGFRPMAGQWDWWPVVLLAGLAVLLFAIGVIGFARRDLGATIRFRDGGRAILPVGLSGPIARSTADRLPLALAGGFGLGLFGLLVAASADAFVKTIQDTPGLEDLINQMLPGVDITSAGGVLGLYFVNFGTLMIGLLGAALVAGWANDERERRLDLVLTTPLARVRYALASGIGVLIGLAVIAAVMGLGIGLGAIALGDDAITPMIGGLVLGLYGAAFAGLGLALGGWGWPGLAGAFVAALVFGTFLLDLIGGIVGFPDWVMQLSLMQHLAHPMTGDFDLPGIALMAVLAIGGLLVGAWGMGRRDIGR